MFVPSIARQVQSSAETAAAETDEELVQQVVMGGSAWCSCVSCYSSSSLGCPIGRPARFCSAVCFATHQASCPFVAFKPVMIVFHESLKGASIGLGRCSTRCPGALQPLLGCVSEIVFCDRLLYSGVSAPAGPQSHRGVLGSPEPLVRVFPTH